MAEPFSIAASAIQVAGAGFSLAKTLHKYIDEVKTAQKLIKSVAVEIKLTASVLEHLGALLQEHEAEKLCSSNVIQDAGEALGGCRAAFEEIEEAFKSSAGDGSRSARFAWPFKKGKVEALQANLERLKSTFLLMLSVISYAREKATRPAEAFSVQRIQIQNLIKAKDDAAVRYEELLVELQALKTNDASQLATAASTARSQPFIALKAADQQPLATVHPAPQGSIPILKQLGICASAVTNLATSISSAMVTYDSSHPLMTSRIRDSYDEVGSALSGLLGRTGDPLLSGATSGLDASLPTGQPRTPSHGNHALEDYQYQLMMLELQNKKRLLMARQEQDEAATRYDGPVVGNYPQRYDRVHDQHEAMVQATVAQAQALKQQPQAPPQHCAERVQAGQIASPGLSSGEPGEPVADATPLNTRKSTQTPNLLKRMFPTKKRKAASFASVRPQDDPVAASPPVPITPTNAASFSHGPRPLEHPSTMAPSPGSEPSYQSRESHYPQIPYEENRNLCLQSETHPRLSDVDSTPNLIGQDMNLDFSHLEGGDVLDNFDFESFLNDGGDDGGSNFDAEAAFGDGAEEDDEAQEEEFEPDGEEDEVEVLIKRWTTIDV